jgi:signal peptidase II
VSNAPIKSPRGKRAGQPAEKGARAQGPREHGSLSGPLPVSRYATYFLLAIAGCAIDLFTKQAVFAWRGQPRPSNEWWIIEPYFGIETSINRGALFGMGAGYWWVFAGLSVVALVGILTWLFVFKAARDRWLTFALGLVTGGILGNLYDRLGLWDHTGLPPDYHHAVRDWILLRYDGHTWPNFNIADSLLVTGAIMLVVHAFLWRESKTTEPAAEEKVGGRESGVA